MKDFLISFLNLKHKGKILICFWNIKAYLAPWANIDVTSILSVPKYPLPKQNNQHFTLYYFTVHIV